MTLSGLGGENKVESGKQCVLCVPVKKRVEDGEREQSPENL